MKKKQWKYFKYTILCSNEIHLYRYTDIKNNMYVNFEKYSKSINKWNSSSMGKLSVKFKDIQITQLEMLELL